MKVLDAVALTEDVAESGLSRGQVGTLVEILAQGIFEVEFADLGGATYASLAIPERKLMVLHHRPHEEAA